MCGRSPDQACARRRVPWAPVFVLATSVVAAAAARASDDRQIREIALAPGAPLTVEITNGRVVVNGTARTNVRVEITRHAPSAEAMTAMPVTISEGADGVQIRVRQAAGATAADLTSDVTLEVPSTATLSDVRVGEGRLDVSDFSGRLAAVVRRGPITATRVTGTLRLETVIGNVEVREARLAADGLIRLRAFNGDVRLSFASTPADARVMALALNGTITSTIPLRVKDGWGPRWAEATLGKGEPVVSLDVVTGAIAIEAAAPHPGR